MNLPNKLTILRVIMIPFFLVFLYMEAPGQNGWHLEYLSWLPSQIH